MRQTWRGFSLVELLVTLAILSILLGLGVSGFSTWIINMKVRAAAESIQNGLQLARGEAVRRNDLIRFQLTDTTDSSCVLSTTDTNWVVSYDNPSGKCGNAFVDEAYPVTDTTHNPAPRLLKLHMASGSSSNVVSAAGQSTIVFNGLGRVTNAATNPVVISLNPGVGVCKVDGGQIRCLNVTISIGGQIRMCDPSYPANGTDPQRCN